MYEDSNMNKINMIGAYLILNYDINDKKAAKLMTIAKSNTCIDEKSKSSPSNTDFSRIYSYIFWQEIKLEQLERLRSEDTPVASWLPILLTSSYYWPVHIGSQVKTRWKPKN